MRRRDFLAAPIASALWQSSAFAQPQTRIGWVTAQRAASTAPYVEAFRSALRELGYDRALTIDFRFGDDDPGRVPELAAELVARPVSILIAQGAAAIIVGKLGLPIPTLIILSADPVAAGLADSLARPRENLTGLTFMAAEMNEKRLELLRDIIPGLRHVGLLANPEHAGEQLERAYSERMAGKLGLEVSYFPTRNQSELAGAFLNVERRGVQGLCVFADGFALQNRGVIAGFGLQKRLPVVSGWSPFAHSGALCTYGPRLTASYRRLAYYVDRIIKGAKPSELPIEQPTELELIINLKTAQALGLTIPPTLLARADEVIE